MFTFLNVRFYSGTPEGVWNIVQTWIRKEKQGYLCVVNAHSLVEGFWHASVRQALQGADLCVPDGMPVVWAGKALGERETQRIYGPDLFLYFCQQAEKLGYRIFLYGTTDKTLKLLERKLRKKFPRLVIVGRFSPPFRNLTSAEEKKVHSLINSVKPHIVWIGLSTPKQELWMRRNLKYLHARALIGVGAAFDFVAGSVRQAPEWMRHSGLEWLFRFLQEPQRLWRRYLINNVIFLFLTAGFFLKRLLGISGERQYDN